VSWILIPVAMVLVLHYFVFSAYHVVGTSMIPTLQDSNYLIVSKIDNTAAALTHHDYIPKREQIIVFHYPKQPTLDFVKRVIALPGERVVVSNCAVTVYNSEKPQGFNPDAVHPITGTCTEGDIDETIPRGNVFVLGENRTPGGSSDSREWGLLPSYDIIGNVVLRLYPVSSLRLF
jgi:signal peptidase I